MSFGNYLVPENKLKNLPFLCQIFTTIWCFFSTLFWPIAFRQIYHARNKIKKLIFQEINPSARCPPSRGKTWSCRGSFAARSPSSTSSTREFRAPTTPILANLTWPKTFPEFATFQKIRSGKKFAGSSCFVSNPTKVENPGEGQGCFSPFSSGKVL